MKFFRKLIKTTLVSVFIIFFGFFVYANLHPMTLSDKVAPVKFLLLSIDNEKDIETNVQKIQDMNGVTACAYNKDSKLMSLSYQYIDINESELLSDVSTLLDDKELKTTSISSKGSGCPYHATLGFFSKVDYYLNLRN